MRNYLLLLSLGVMAPICFAQDAKTKTIIEISESWEPQIVRPKGPPELLIQLDIAEYFNRLNLSDDVDSLYDCVWNPRIGYFGANRWLKGWKVFTDANILVNYRVHVDKVQGDDATATVYYILKRTRQGAQHGYGPENEMFQEIVTLKSGKKRYSDEQIWQIVARETPPTSRKSYLNNAAFQIAQRQWKAHSVTYAELSLRKLERLAKSVNSFIVDYDERFVFAPEYLQEALDRGGKSDPKFYLNPATDAPYTFNENLCDKFSHDVKSPEKTVMFYEGRDEKPVFRYDGKAAIAFVDGHSELVTPKQVKDLVWRF